MKPCMSGECARSRAMARNMQAHQMLMSEGNTLVQMHAPWANHYTYATQQDCTATGGPVTNRHQLPCHSLGRHVTSVQQCVLHAPCLMQGKLRVCKIKQVCFPKAVRVSWSNPGRTRYWHVQSQDQVQLAACPRNSCPAAARQTPEKQCVTVDVVLTLTQDAPQSMPRAILRKESRTHYTILPRVCAVHRLVLSH
jgi:hypothetical protein